MHFPGPDPEALDAFLYQAVKETARGACHLADLTRSLPPAPCRESASEAAAQAALEAGLLASRALFALEDAMQTRADPVAPAIAALIGAEEAIRAARLALEARVSRSLRPEAAEARAPPA